MTTIQKGFRAACWRAGIEDFCVHDLRHTFASWLVMAGVSLYVVKDRLGHSSITVTERYAHLALHMGHAAVQLLLPVE
ncbi:tyrosine-type recombinase/integrase [Burkholderia pseudomallei]|uniref:tyrosine-type recombinase/integrase n=1 Tax=Burkholderia pseudomallei TaxID=28450 RepID=UPI001EEE5A19|nr:tyrosine-type recombinase/integrase [Burkholderia pseudomallei]